MTDYLFYHRADLDGRASGAIASRALPDYKAVGIDYGDRFPWEIITPKMKVVMVDYSLEPFAEMVKLHQICGELTWIDHHKSAMDEAKTYSFEDIKGLRRIGQAACELCWEYFHTGEATPTAINLAGRYDVWDHKDERVLPFQYGMYVENTEPDSALWDQLLSGPDSLVAEGLVKEIIRLGGPVEEYIKQNNAAYIKARGFETELEGHKAICCNKGLANSKLFDSVWDPTKYDLMITFIRLPSEQWTVSMYTTKDEVDCGEIAKKHGGGGHQKAAGFQCVDLPFKY